jgi:hypothetical protein
MADYWEGAAIALTGALAGIVVGAVLSEVRDRWKEHTTKKRVGSALALEIHSMIDMVATCASLANFAQFELRASNELMATPLLINHLPPEPTAYRAMASQLPLLDIDTVSAVIAFYGSLELAKRISTQHSSEESIPKRHLPILGNCWRGAARVGALAFQRANQYAPAPINQADVNSLHELRLELIAIQNGEWPRVERTDTGALNIARASIRAQQA